MNARPADITPYDALLVVSFGGPEGHDDVLPFLRNVTAGRGVPDERLADVAEHYHAFGGVSPINDQVRELIAAVDKEFAEHRVGLPIYWGNRNWRPMLADTVRAMTEDGVRRALVFVTSAYASYSGCRQYRENLAAAVAALGADAGRAPRFDKLRHYFNHPGFVQPMTDNTLSALAALPPAMRERARLVFTTHSLPLATASSAGPDGDAYVAEHNEVAALVAEGVARETGRLPQWDLVYSSRSGAPGTPWLEPDVGDHLRALRAEGTPAAVLVPIGFVSDHMEVRYDLDVQARQQADQVGLVVERAATVGADPRFVTAVRELVLERCATERGESPTRPALGRLGPCHDVCPAHCCPNPRGPRPVLA